MDQSRRNFELVKASEFLLLFLVVGLHVGEVALRLVGKWELDRPSKRASSLLLIG